MKKLITTVIMLAIFLFALSTGVQAYTMTFTGTNKTPTVVEAGDTFNVVVTVDEQTVLANGHLSFNESLFTFIGATQANMAANVENLNWIALEGVEHINEVKWMYTDLSSNLESGAGTKTFVFTFQAADVSEEKTGRFTLNDFVVTTANNNAYDNNETTATEEKIQGSNYIDITIKPKSETPSPADWSLTPSGEVSIKKGETKQITVNGDVEVEWSSSDTSVAKVDQNGKITAVGEGTAYITATKSGGGDAGVSAQRIKIIVTGDDDKIKLDPSEDFTLEKGKTNQIKISGAEGTVTWKSSNEKVATVDKDGKVTAVGAGTATITATDSEGNSKSIKVTVSDSGKKNDGKNTSKDNSALPGKKDNTLTPDSQLPKTGGDFGKFLVLSLTAVILAAGLVFKSKAKKLNKLFVIIPLVAIVSLSGFANAGKVVDTSSIKAGIFENGELLENMSIIAVSPSTDFRTSTKLTPEMIENITLETIIEIKDISTNLVENPEFVGTGYEIRSGRAAGGETIGMYEAHRMVLLYGDANGDGSICNSFDIDVIRQDYVFGNKAEGVYKLAADLYADGTLNVRDIQRMVKKYVGTLDSSLVTPFPDDGEITATISIAAQDENGVTVQATVNGERLESVIFSYRETGDDNAEFTELPSTTEPNHTFTTEELEPGKTYEVKATVKAKNGEEYDADPITVTIPAEAEETLNVDIEPIGDDDTYRISVSSSGEDPITEYRYVIEKDGEGEEPYETTSNSSQVRVTLDPGTYTITITGTTNTGKTVTGTATYTIIPENTDGETDDINEAVAVVYSTEKMYTSLQAAIDAAKPNSLPETVTGPQDERITLIKDTVESIEIPNDIYLILDINGHSITSPEDADYVIKNNGGLTLTNTSHAVAANQNPEIIITKPSGTGILIENDNTPLEVLSNIDIILQKNGTTGIKNTGNNCEININGTKILAEYGTMGTNGISDSGNNTNVLITRGIINTYSAIGMGSNGTLTIGVDGGDIHKDTEYLYIVGASCIIANASTEVNFYDGYLKATYTDAITCLDPAKANAYNPLERRHPFNHSREDLGIDSISAGGPGINEAYYVKREYLSLKVEIDNTINNENKTVTAWVNVYGKEKDNITNIAWYYEPSDSDTATKVFEGANEDIAIFENSNNQYGYEYSIYAIVTTGDGTEYESNRIYVNVGQLGEVTEKIAKIEVTNKTSNELNLKASLDGETTTITEVTWLYRPNFWGTAKTDRLGRYPKQTAATTTESTYTYTHDLLDGSYTGWYSLSAIIKEGTKVYYADEIEVYFPSADQPAETPDITLNTEVVEDKILISVTINDNSIHPVAYTYIIIKLDNQNSHSIEADTVTQLPNEITITENGMYRLQVTARADNGETITVSNDFTITEAR